MSTTKQKQPSTPAKAPRAKKPTTPLGAMAQVLAPAPAPTPAAQPTGAIAALPAPLPALPAPLPTAYSMRSLRGGGLTITIAPGKPYRVAAPLCVAWYAQVQAVWQATGQRATVAQMLAAGVPSHFVGYMLRRGWAVPTQAA